LYNNSINLAKHDGDNNNYNNNGNPPPRKALECIRQKQETSWSPCQNVRTLDRRQQARRGIARSFLRSYDLQRDCRVSSCVVKMAREVLREFALIPRMNKVRSNVCSVLRYFIFTFLNCYLTCNHRQLESYARWGSGSSLTVELVRELTPRTTPAIVELEGEFALRERFSPFGLSRPTIARSGESDGPALGGRGLYQPARTRESSSTCTSLIFLTTTHPPFALTAKVGLHSCPFGGFWATMGPCCGTATASREQLGSWAVILLQVGS
jgi:hypothetical protein